MAFGLGGRLPAVTLELSVLDWVASLIAGGGVVLGLGAGAALLARREGSRLANASMGGLLVVAALAVLYVLLLTVQPPGENLGVVFAPLPYTFAIGPLLYVYVRARLGQGPPGWGHAVLPAVQALVILGVALAPFGVQRWYMGAVFAPWWAQVQVAVAALSIASYLALSWAALRRAPGAFEWSRRRDRWLRAQLAGATVVPFVLVTMDVVIPAVTGGPGRPALASFLENLVYGGSLYLVALGGLVQAEVRVPRAAAPERKEHYNLDPDLAAAHRAALDALVARDAPHLDPNLSLGTLAAQLGVTDKVLSYLLNESMETTYTDFVNGLRVGEAQRRLVAPEHGHLSVLAVGLDAGFASKSTFNRVFKESTGQTPSAYRAAAREAPAAARAIAS